MSMLIFYHHHNWKRYLLTLDASTGEVIAYAVEVNAKGRAPSDRHLWCKHSGKPMPQGLKDVLNSKGCLEQIAYTMRGSSQLPINNYWSEK